MSVRPFPPGRWRPLWPLVVAAAIVLALPPEGRAADPTPGTLQQAIDATAAGGSLTVAPGIYRETVTIRQPITIIGAGAEVRGSDVWTAWSADGTRWRSADRVPEMAPTGECRDATCAWPEQAFLDGIPLEQVAATPGAGEFAVDADRRVVLGDDPTGRLVEVTTRERWMMVEAPDVTIDGLTMRHAASPAQHGGLETAAGADRLTVRGVTLSDAHGALVSVRDVSGASLLDSVLTRGGQLAVHAGGDGTQDLTIARNRITDSNTEGFAPGWEAGGVKAALATGLVFEDNVVTGNDGPGLWCDIDCRDVRYVGNRVGDNANTGIQFEISEGALIADNVIWENGWSYTAWGWGAGILVSSSADVEVRDNVLAWNADGITIVSQGREDGVRTTGVRVLGNTLLKGPEAGFQLAWLQDWDGGMFSPTAANTAEANAFWRSPDATGCDYEWDGCRGDLTAFSATPGGSASRALTDDEHRASLVDAGLVDEPKPHVVGLEPPPWRTLVRPALLVGVILLVAAVGAILVWRRRRRTTI